MLVLLIIFDVLFLLHFIESKTIRKCTSLHRTKPFIATMCNFGERKNRETVYVRHDRSHERSGFAHFVNLRVQDLIFDQDVA